MSYVYKVSNKKLQILEFNDTYILFQTILYCQHLTWSLSCFLIVERQVSKVVYWKESESFV